MTLGSFRPSGASAALCGTVTCSCSFIGDAPRLKLTRSAARGFAHRCWCVSRRAGVGKEARADSLSDPLTHCENARVVVQCPSCQTRFRVADEKVGERGVRVRCSSCKDVFSVKKSGISETGSSSGSGNAIDLSTLDPPMPPSKPGSSSGKIGVSGGKPGQKPTTGRASQPTAKPPGGGLEAEDLFGMSELTGESDSSG